MSAWNLFYEYFNPVAFSLFGLKVHWYGICYVFALFLALCIAKFILRRYPHRFTFDENILDSYFIWVEIGVILGARLGYLLVYSDFMFYLTHPLQIFNPFNKDGEFIGIAGFSYHGSLVGFIIVSVLFCKFKKVNFLHVMDLATLSIPLAYFFGRVGNFLNQELYGREIQNQHLEFLGIFVDGALRYPSQLFEAFTEGILLFILLFFVFKFSKKAGIVAASYGVGYAGFRFVCEYFRKADEQMGYYMFGLSMGQILSIAMFLCSAGFGIYLFLKRDV